VDFFVHHDYQGSDTRVIPKKILVGCVGKTLEKTQQKRTPKLSQFQFLMPVIITDFSMFNDQ